MMRSFIDSIRLVENHADWFENGEPVDLADPRWENQTDFIEGDEFDYDWRLCMVPSSVVEPKLIDEPEQRISDIVEWMGGYSSIDQALIAQPPVALMTATGMRILDGNHRAHVAVQSDLPHVPMLIAFGELND